MSLPDPDYGKPAPRPNVAGETCGGDTPPAADPFPQAEVRAAARPALRQLALVLRSYWWVVAAALVLSVTLVVTSWWSRGPVVRIHFEQGHGIKPGDALQYRGIEVGRVEAVQLKEGAKGIRLDVRLAAKARSLAREGAQFWIERPQVSLARVRGLETVVGAKYVAVLPGPEEGKARHEFRGSETPIWLSDAGETELMIDFRQGEGLSIGDPMRYRGISIGEVVGIALADDQQTVQVRIRLTQTGAQVAVAGSQFWIEHPELTFAGVRGLDTIVGGRYVAVIPGPAGGEPQRHFVGLEEAPAKWDRSPEGLEILLVSSHRRGLQRGVPVSYRGLPIGRVLSVGLAADALTVEARVYIQPLYKHLVRQDSKFWNMGGAELKAGVSGVQWRLDSMESLFRGGVAMATPANFGPPATTGNRFPFHDEPDEKWLEWKPQIAVGATVLPSDLQLPIPQRAQLRWQTRRLGFRRTERILGWVLPLDSKRLLSLAEVLSPPEENRDTAMLEIEGRQYSLSDAQWNTAGGVGVAALADFASQHAVWPRQRIRIPDKPEDCLVVAGDSSSQLPLAAGRLKAADAGWSIDNSLSFDETDWHGACVVAASDGMLVGLLRVNRGTGFVVFVPPMLLEH